MCVKQHAWIQEFLPGGVQALLLLYSGLSMVYCKENYNFPRFQRGSNIFQGGSIIFQGGPIFSRGGGGGGGGGV